MPNKKLVCEFCNIASRKDLIAGHIGSKCIAGVAKMLLKEWKDGEKITPIKQFMEARPTQNIPIFSQLYEGSVYWFGVEPKMFDEEDSWATYIKSEENLMAHNLFLKECLRHITLMDFLECERDFQVKTPEVMELNRKQQDIIKVRLEEEKQHIMELDGKNRIIQRLTSELEDIKDSMDAPDTIHSLQVKLSQLESSHRMISSQLRTTHNRLSTIEDEHQKSIEEIYESNRIRRQTDEDMYEKLNLHYKTLKANHEKLQLNLKKEAQKIADKQDKQREKEKEKARQAKEKLREEILLAKMKARRTSPKHKKHYSSSSSSSSSESNSDSEDDQ